MISTISGALRIPAIAAFLAGLAANILTFFSARLTKSIAINLTVVTMVVGLAAHVAAAIYLIGTGIAAVAPPFASMAWGYVVPSNAVPCLSAIFSARVVRWVWAWQFYVITKVSS